MQNGKESGSILIAGAGCAGLSLAMHLILCENVTQKIVLVEPRLREDYTNDRTWSGFATKPHLFSGLASNRWQRWKCKSRSGENISESSRYSYESIRASDYYRFCFDRLLCDPRIEIHFGCRIVNSANGSFEIIDRSDRLKACVRPGHFFDSRPQNDSHFSGNRDDVSLWQQFSGIEVAMVRDTFDPSVATLMDFDVDQGNAIRFIYVLPFSKRRALVESTVFSASRVPFDQLKSDVETHLTKIYGENSWSQIGCENGRIPMVTAEIKSSLSRGITKIGLSGGLARPSTGYAFASIHGHSRRIANALDRGLPVPDRKQDQLSKVLDRIFLSYLAKNPDEASELFLRISRKTDPDRFARFMMDTGSLLDKLAVIMSMPKLPFILEAWHSRKIWLTRRPHSSSSQRLPRNSEAHS